MAIIGISDTESKPTLHDFLEAQRLLQKQTYGVDFETMTTKQRVDFIRYNVLALTDELHEALAETSWKPWADATYINDDALKGELIDALHFLGNLMLVAGMDADEVTARYFAKRKINIQRQDEGYDGKTGKCRGCRRALDDKSVLCGDVDEDDDMWCDDNAAWYGSTGLRVY